MLVSGRVPTSLTWSSSNPGFLVATSERTEPSNRYSQAPSLRDGCSQWVKLVGNFSVGYTSNNPGVQNHFLKRNTPPWEWIHIPPKGKFGKSSTQNAILRGYVSSPEGNAYRKPIVVAPFFSNLKRRNFHL